MCPKGFRARGNRVCENRGEIQEKAGDNPEIMQKTAAYRCIFTMTKYGRLKFHNVINLRVVRNIFHISHYFYCKYAIIVVRKEVGVFIKILTKTYKGEKRYYASLVENKRIDGKVVQRVKANLGPVTEEQIPYLKAAYARKKPHLVYDDE